MDRDVYLWQKDVHLVDGDGYLFGKNVHLVHKNGVWWKDACARSGWRLTWRDRHRDVRWKDAHSVQRSV